MDEKDWELVEALMNLPIGALLLWASYDLTLDEIVSPGRYINGKIVPTANWVDVELIGLEKGFNWAFTVVSEYDSEWEKTNPFCLLSPTKEISHRVVTECLQAWLKKEIQRDDIVVMYNEEHITKMEINVFNASEGFTKG
jgi:hypothetical protein